MYNKLLRRPLLLYASVKMTEQREETTDLRSGPWALPLRNKPIS